MQQGYQKQWKIKTAIQVTKKWAKEKGNFDYITISSI